MDIILDRFEDRAVNIQDMNRALEYKWLRLSRYTSNMSEIDLVDAVEAIHYSKDK